MLLILLNARSLVGGVPHNRATIPDTEITRDGIYIINVSICIRIKASLRLTVRFHCD